MKPSGTSPYVLAFAELMEAKLDENRHKGDREGWLKSNLGWLFDRLEDECNELYAALQVNDDGVGLDGAKVARECADVANFAMMIADVVGGLKPQFTPRGRCL